MKLMLCCLTLLSCALKVWSLTTAELAVIAQYNPNVTYTENKRKGTLKFVSQALPNYYSPWYSSITQTLNPFKMTVHSSPVVADSPICLHSTSIAMAVNGVPIYRPYTGQGLNAITAEILSFDNCQGHTTPAGRYHYHGVFECLVDTNQTDQFLGVAEDGYPIYGPFDANGEVLKADLDECQGRTETVDGQDVYRYRMTSTFPYTLGCFHGKTYSDKSDDDKCLFPNDCGENPGSDIASTDPLYNECGGPNWASSGGAGGKRSNIEAKIEAIEEMHETAKKELQQEIKSELEEGQQFQIEGQKAYNSIVESMRRSFNERKALKSGANVKSSAARQMAQADSDNYNENEDDLT